MKTSLSKFLILLPLLFLATAAKSQNDKYLGLWQTIDDETNKPRSVVELYLLDGKLNGKIVKVFPQPGEVSDPVCDACKGDLHNKKIIEMQIISDMKFKKGEWKNGQILDPDNGKFYDCKIWLEDDKLKVRGYIGFFYRTQEWLKYDTEI